MAEHAIGVEVVTPEEALYAGPAAAVVLATSEGDLTIMAEHAEMIGDVVAGIVKIETLEGPTIDVAVHGGFVQVHTAVGEAGALVEDAAETDRTTRVTLLAGVAELTTEIDVPRAQAAKAAAEARVGELRSSTGRSGDESAADVLADLAVAEAELARAELRLSIPASQI
jgi:F-type H+-transporting ATPase subunit epsilon